MKRKYSILLLVLLFFILSLISLFIGVKNISLSDILRFSDDSLQILILSRFPRLISIIIAGVGMSISGLIMQQISQNKFVSPTTAATIDSAQLGVLVSLILFSTSSTMIKMIVAFIFSLAGSFLFLTILRKIKVKNAIMLPLIGIMLGRVINAITSYFSYQYDLVQNVSSWMQGDFSMIIKGRYELLYISIPLLIIAYIYANKFTLAGMGEDFSSSLGLDYQSIVKIGISIVALISAVVVITIGRIPFLGLIIPNIISMYQGDNLKKNILPTALFGAVFLLFSDIVGRIVIYPYEIPIGLTVGVIGSFVFLLMIWRNKNAK